MEGEEDVKGRRVIRRSVGGQGSRGPRSEERKWNEDRGRARERVKEEREKWKRVKG